MELEAQNEVPRILKIALTGAHGTGKTTLIEALEREFKQRGYSIEIVREIPRIICKKVGNSEFFRRGNNTFEKQAILLQGQIQAESLAIGRFPQIMLCDRSILDHWVYTAHLHHRSLEQTQVLEAYTSLVVEHCKTYDMLFYIPIEFKLIDDGIREADGQFQKDIDHGILNFLTSHKLNFVEVNGPTESRCKTIAKFVEDFLNKQRHHLEINPLNNSNEIIATTPERVHNVSDADSAYVKILTDILSTKNQISSCKTQSIGSEQKFKEILHYSLVIEHPQQRLVWNPKYKFNLPLAVARFVWMMAGNDRLKDIQFYTDNVVKFSDDGVIVPGSSYGHRIIYPTPGCNQIEGIIQRLKEDPATRRAAISVYQAEDAVRQSKDIPCTFGLGFHNRNGFLHPSVIMRSNNAFNLFPYNIFEFSLLGEAIAGEVGLNIGSLSYYAMSMHVYSKDYQAAQNVIGAGSATHERQISLMPREPSPLKQINELVKLESEARHAASGFSRDDFESKWVHYADKTLHPYWLQFYYQLLLAMCIRVKFQQGCLILQKYISEPWISYLPSENFKTAPTLASSLPQQGPDLFTPNITSTNQTELKVEKKIPLRVPKIEATVNADSTSVSKADLENELDNLLKLYKPFVAQNQWEIVLEYRAAFLDKANKTPENAAKIIGRMREMQFALAPHEKVEANRAPAARIISQLNKLLS